MLIISTMGWSLNTDAEINFRNINSIPKLDETINMEVEKYDTKD